jgi:hypothetical protein
MTPAVILLATTLAVGISPPLLGYRASPPIEYDPNIYAAALGTEVTYDDFVAQRYDDGYEPKAFAPFERALAPYGGPSLDLVPRRRVPAIFVHTAVLSKARSVSMRGLTVRVPAGPDPARCCTTEVQPVPLSLAAPSACPRVPVEPRRGTPLETRPWSVAGWREQTPIVPWPAPGRS